ncbi:MAG TPA: sodium:proton antiporter [Candidatus Saccharimonadales bacterium]|nr:sodium:proton antiporter [Candidatus Saccharimonadales bacterium]
MTLSIEAVLALFSLLLISSAVFFVSRRIRMPYTVLLVLVGLLLVPFAKLPYLEPVFGFLDDLVLTPELLFYIFLPILIFESAFNMNIRRMVENAWSISLLAIVGLMISAGLIAAALYYLLPLIGLEIPFIVALLFGAIISSTDPVAVLALFKELGAPKRLTMIFEGESLFNDGTAVALFLAILAVAETGFHGAGTVLEGLFIFIMMLSSGILLGILMAGLFSRALRYTRGNEFVTVTLLIVSAHFVFILGELINAKGLFGLHMHVSSIIATTVAALFLGNYARHALSPRSDQYIAKSVEHLAFVANSLVFLLAGILFASTRVNLNQLWLPILLTIVIVALARIISVYAVLVPLGWLKLEAPVPPSWQKLLAWGSLRGALAIIVVLLIPDNFRPAGWQYAYSPQEFLLALTIGCILATLFIKGLTIAPLMHRLGVDKPDPLDEARRIDLGLYYLITERERFKQQMERGFIRQDQYDTLAVRLQKNIDGLCKGRDKLADAHGRTLFEQSLRLMAIDIEERYLKELYTNNELSEQAYRIIIGKLNLQREKIEHAEILDIDPSLYTDRKDVFDRLVGRVQGMFDRQADKEAPAEKYRYYRAQAVISRKVVKILTWMQEQYGEDVFLPEVYEGVKRTYIDYQNAATKRMEVLYMQHAKELQVATDELTRLSLHASGNKALEFFEDKGIADETLLEDIERRFGMAAK